MSSGKIDVRSGIRTITIQAPPGKKISQVCVKAGSAQQDLGAKYIDYDPAKVSVTFRHPSGKDISHYSVRYVNGGSGGYNG